MAPNCAKFVLLATTLALAATTRAVADLEVGESSFDYSESIILFTETDFESDYVAIGVDAPSLLPPFSGAVQSCITLGGSWILYTEPAFKGDVSFLFEAAEYPTPTDMGIPGGSLSSLRHIPEPAEKSILLFEEMNFGGRMVHITGTTDDLAFADFSDRAASAVVLSGTWRVYNGPRRTGASFDLPPGNYPDAGPGDMMTVSLEPID